MFLINLSRKAVKNLKLLKRKFRKIEDDLDKLFFLLSQEKIIGDRIQNLSASEIYKARLKNSSSSTGGKGGFRVIYYVKRDDGEIFVLAIYSKTQKSDISRKEILEILKEEELC